MAEQLRGPFEKLVYWRQCAAVMLLCLPRITEGHCRQSTNFSNGPRTYRIKRPSLWQGLTYLYLKCIQWMYVCSFSWFVSHLLNGFLRYLVLEVHSKSSSIWC